MPLGKNLLRLSYARFEDLGQIQDLGGTIANANERIDHLFVALERRGEGRFVQVTAGARYETRLADPDVHDVQLHLDLDLLAEVAKIPVELKYLVYRQVEHGQITGNERTYDVNDLVASVRPVRWLTVAALLNTTTDQNVLSGFGGHEGNLSKYTFGALELAVEPTQNSNFRLFAGGTQGGLKCSGGVCRVIPAFEGVKLEWLARF